MLNEIQRLIDEGFETEHGHTILNMDRIKEKFPHLIEESGQMDWKFFEENVRPNHHIMTRPEKNSLTVTLMDRPASEGGRGLQWYEVIELILAIFKGLNDKFPCRENSIAIRKFEEGLMWNRERTRRRIKEGIEGTNKETQGIPSAE